MSAMHGVPENLKKTLWSLAKPAIVAMVVALLVSLGVAMTRSGPDFTAAGTTHFANLAVVGDASVGGTLSVVGGHNYSGLVGATNGFTCATNVTGTSSTGMLRYASAVISTTLDTQSISVTTGITAATAAISGGSLLTGEVLALNGIRLTGGLTGTAAAGGLRFGSGIISSTLDANAISVTTGITVATAKVTGGAQVTGELKAGNGLLVGGSLTGTSGTGQLHFQSGAFTTTLTAGMIFGSAALLSGGTISVSPADPITVTQATDFEILSSFQPIWNNTWWVSPTILAGSSGQFVVLINVGPNSIGLTDTGTLRLAGNVTLGLSDTLGLVFDGDNWVELFRSNN